MCQILNKLLLRTLNVLIVFLANNFFLPIEINTKFQRQRLYIMIYISETKLVLQSQQITVHFHLHGEKSLSVGVS